MLTTQQLENGVTLNFLLLILLVDTTVIEGPRLAPFIYNFARNNLIYEFDDGKNPFEGDSMKGHALVGDHLFHLHEMCGMTECPTDHSILDRGVCWTDKAGVKLVAVYKSHLE